jgi:hypothetical protein
MIMSRYVTSAFRRQLGISAGTIMVAGFMSGCAVTESNLVDISNASACSSALGSYTLPRTYLRAVVERVKDENGTNIVMAPLAQIRRPDNDRFYCLDHLASAFAKDDVRITKATLDVAVTKQDGTPGTASRPTQYLGIISSAAVDQTAIIIRKLIRAIAIGITKNAGFLRSKTETAAPPERTTLLTVEFDPFDAVGTAKANADLRKFGFCVALETFSFNTHRYGVPAYCNNPVRVASDATEFSVRYQADLRGEAKPLPAKGIYYRPRANYRAMIFTNAEPDLPGRWKLSVMQDVTLENISPVIAVRIDRSVFAQRRMALVFDQGALLNVCLYKGSEVLGFIDIPLEIVRSIVALPVATLQVRYQELVTSTELYNAERQLIELQRKQIDYINEKNKDILEDIANKERPKQPNAPAPPTSYSEFKALDDVPEFTSSEVLGSDLAAICNSPRAQALAAAAGGANP